MSLLHISHEVHHVAPYICYILHISYEIFMSYGIFHGMLYHTIAVYKIATGSNVSYGARPLRRAVQRLFEDPLAEFLVSGELREGGEVTVDVEQEEVVLRRPSMPLLQGAAVAF